MGSEMCIRDRCKATRFLRTVDATLDHVDARAREARLSRAVDKLVCMSGAERMHYAQVTCASGKCFSTACCMVNLYTSVSRSDERHTGSVMLVCSGAGDDRFMWRKAGNWPTLDKVIYGQQGEAGMRNNMCGSRARVPPGTTRGALRRTSRVSHHTRTCLARPCGARAPRRRGLQRSRG